ncbi:regulator of G-protein signaling 12-like, partial [Oncorhynchus keta]|uniref:regulator of G-protein signaling 12-like n=1 Tax=Oncorhynchus keta TaxID=8018 RepID=UPI00227C7957
MEQKKGSTLDPKEFSYGDNPKTHFGTLFFQSLSQRARQIYNSYLSSKATTPVNIDSQAQLADDILNAPRPDMFKEQQLQIFNLMKFDSYTRFLKSLLYQECMLAEVEGRPLPDPYHIPSSPTSKHSTGSDRSTPKK